jgi:hypothetical protein
MSSDRALTSFLSVDRASTATMARTPVCWPVWSYNWMWACAGALAHWVVSRRYIHILFEFCNVTRTDHTSMVRNSTNYRSQDLKVQILCHACKNLDYFLISFEVPGQSLYQLLEYNGEVLDQIWYHVAPTQLINVEVMPIHFEKFKQSFQNLSSISLEWYRSNSNTCVMCIYEQKEKKIPETWYDCPLWSLGLSSVIPSLGTNLLIEQHMLHLHSKVQYDQLDNVNRPAPLPMLSVYAALTWAIWVSGPLLFCPTHQHGVKWVR